MDLAWNVIPQAGLLPPDQYSVSGHTRQHRMWSNSVRHCSVSIKFNVSYHQLFVSM